MLASLQWLARHQYPDGSWSVQGYVQQCKATCSPNPGCEDFDTGVTGLALLAFLGAGYSHLSKDTYDGVCFGDVVRKGLQWMMARQDAEGGLGPRVEKFLYNHAIGTLALAEAYGMTGSNLFLANAQKAVDFLVAAQNPGKGWRYSPRSGDNDSSVTGWAVMALKSAELSGLAFPRASYDGARAWFNEATETGSARTGYTHAGTGKVFLPGLNEAFDPHETMTAVALLSKIFMNPSGRGESHRGACELLLRERPSGEGGSADFYFWYCASLALFQLDGPAGAAWKQWDEPLRKLLVSRQNANSTGCRRGSWEPVDRWGCEGGRVYATAINALTLEVHYRYANAFGGNR